MQMCWTLGQDVRSQTVTARTPHSCPGIGLRIGQVWVGQGGLEGCLKVCLGRNTARGWGLICSVNAALWELGLMFP